MPRRPGQLGAGMDFLGPIYDRRFVALGTALALVTIIAASPVLAFGLRSKRHPAPSALYVQQAKLVPSPEISTAASGIAGEEVALSADGNTALIAGDEISGEKNYASAAWIFSRPASAWTQQAELRPPEQAGLPASSSHVALSADGNTALVGNGGDMEDTGSAWVYVRAGSTWTLEARLRGEGEVGRGQ